MTGSREGERRIMKSFHSTDESRLNNLNIKYSSSPSRESTHLCKHKEQVVSEPDNSKEKIRLFKQPGTDNIAHKCSKIPVYWTRKKRKNEARRTYSCSYSFYGSSKVFMRSRAVRWYANKASQMRIMGETTTTTTCRRPFRLFFRTSHYGGTFTFLLPFCNASLLSLPPSIYLCIKKEEFKILFWFYASSFSFHHSVYLFRSPLHHRFALRKKGEKCSRALFTRFPKKCLTNFETFLKEIYITQKDEDGRGRQS